MTGKKKRSKVEGPKKEEKSKDPRDLAIAEGMKAVQKEFGKESIAILGEAPKTLVKTFPTGSLKLDKALGVGGLPKGRIIEFYGENMSGKTTLALHSIASVQKQGGRAMFIDVEHALDPIYAEALGVDVDNLVISQPDYGEQALEICDTMIRTAGLDLIVLDSVAALVPKAELEGEMEQNSIGLQARLMSKALRKITGEAHKTNTTVIFINQTRVKIGVMFGDPTTTSGGNALKFYASVRCEVRRSSAIKDSSDQIIGNKTKIKIVKNKVAPPFKTAETEIYYGKGIWELAEIRSLAEEYKIIKKSGAWYSYNGENVAQGQVKMLKYLEDNDEVREEIKRKVIEKLYQS